MPRAKLIVGLGNPGAKYRLTRHNFGYLAIDQFAKSHNWGPWQTPAKFNAQLINLRATSLWLAKPTTFMNQSGLVIGQLCRYYHINPADLLVVYDDVHLPFSSLRSRQGGSSGGHRGVESVIQHLGSNFWRLRLGVGQPRRGTTETYVLKKFGVGERLRIQPVLDEAVKHCDLFVQDQLVATTTK